MAEDIIARLHDGTELHFPAGTSNEVVDRVVRSHLSETTSSPDVPKAFEDKPLTPIAPSNKLIELLSSGKAKNLQQFLYGGEQPAESTLGKAGQLIEQSGLEGLTGIGPIAQTSAVVPSLLSKSPTIQKAAVALSEVPSQAVSKAKETLAPIAEKIEPYMVKAKEIPAQLLSIFSSGQRPEAFKVAYNIAKESNPLYAKMYKEGKKFELPEEAEAIYNYSRKFGLPHDWAIQARHMNSLEEDLGTWWLKKQYEKQFKIPLNRQKSYEWAWEHATPQQKLKLAETAGVDFRKFSPIRGSTGEDVPDLIDKLKDVGLVGALSQFLPHLSFLKSPRLASYIATTAGKGAKYVGKTGEMIPPILQGTKNLSKSQILGGLSQAVPREED